MIPRSIRILPRLLSAILIVQFAFSGVGTAFAAVPLMMGFQGQLTNSSGNPLGGSAGADYTFKFAIYDSLSGGVQVWPASTPPSITLRVTNGVFSTLLGDASAGYSSLDIDFANPSLWLEVQVVSSSTETLSPRQRIGASAYAINAAMVHGGQFLNATGVGQFGGLATATYSRFGTGSSTHGLATASQALFSDSAEFDGQLFIDQSASVSFNLEVSGYASISQLFGAGLSSCSGAGQKLLWSSATGHFSCGSDSTGTGGALVGFRELGNSFSNKSSVSFSAAGFTVDTSGSDVVIGLDYANGPASRTISQTISGAWNFSTNPTFNTARLVTSNSLDFDELANGLVLDANTTVTGGPFSLTFDHASTSGVFEAATIRATTISRDSGVISIANNTSASLNFEVIGYASSSQFFGAGLTSSCSSASSKLTWSGGVFGCGVNTSVTSNSLNFDELQDALVIDANTTVTGGLFSLTFDHASISGSFETLATASFWGDLQAANSMWFKSNGLVFEGSTADVAETTLVPGNPAADITITLPTTTTVLAGVGIANTWNALQVFANASASGNFELTSSTSRLGINPGNRTDTTLEVGGIASISGTLFANGALTLLGQLSAVNGSFTGLVDINPTTLNVGSSALSITVPASTSANLPHGALLIQDANNLALASLSNAGRLGLRGSINSHGSQSSCTGLGAPSAGCVDYAEAFPTSDSTLRPGELVAADETRSQYVNRSMPGSLPIGVVSTNPATLVTGTEFVAGALVFDRLPSGMVPIALAGRVPVRVTSENGPIKVGDYLTNSGTVDGAAMRATRAGRVIGQALESYDANGVGSILVLINNTYYGGAVEEEVVPTTDAAQDVGGSIVSLTAAEIEGPLISALSDQIVAVQERVTALASSALDVRQDLFRAGGLSIGGMSVLNGGLRVDSIGTASVDVLRLLGDVEFIGRPYVNRDTAGFAEISRGHRSVTVTFEREYLEQPIVNSTMTVTSDDDLVALLGGQVRYAVTNASTKGFNIVLNEDAPADIMFSWTAFAVKNAHTFISTPDPIPVVAPPLEQLLMSSPEETPGLSMPESGSPLPESSVEPSEELVPQPTEVVVTEEPSPDPTPVIESVIEVDPLAVPEL